MEHGCMQAGAHVCEAICVKQEPALMPEEVGGAWVHAWAKKKLQVAV